MKVSEVSRFALGFCVVIGMLEGCGGSQGQIGAPSAVAQSRGIINSNDYRFPAKGQGAGDIPIHQQSSTSGDLYVTTDNSNECCKVVGAVYKPGATKPSQLIKSASGYSPYKGVLSPINMGFDHAGNLYIANIVGSSSSVWVFAPGKVKPKRIVTNGITEPFAFAFDKRDNVYIANGGTGFGSSIVVYEAGATKRKYTITDGIFDPYAMVFDAAGNLYVVNATGYNVTVYAPGKTEPFRTISKGLDQPQSLAFDTSGNLYVASYQNSTVQVYGPGSTQPAYTISTGISYPVFLLFDHSGNLFVANQGNGTPIVTVYAPGKKMPSYTIPAPEPSSVPEFQSGPQTQMAFDTSGNLYVGYSFEGPIGKGIGGVAVFPPGAKKPTYILTWAVRSFRGAMNAVSISP